MIMIRLLRSLRYNSNNVIAFQAPIYIKHRNNQKRFLFLYSKLQKKVAADRRCNSLVLGRQKIELGDGTENLIDF